MTMSTNYKQNKKKVFLKKEFHGKNRLLERRFAINPFFKLISTNACLTKKHKKINKKCIFFGKFGRDMSL